MFAAEKGVKIQAIQVSTIDPSKLDVSKNCLFLHISIFLSGYVVLCIYCCLSVCVSLSVCCYVCGTVVRMRTVTFGTTRDQLVCWLLATGLQIIPFPGPERD